MKERILLVENDDATRNSLAAIFETAEYECRKAKHGGEVHGLFQSNQEFELMVVGITPTKESEMLIADARERFSEMPVVVVCAVNEIPAARSAIRRGAYDYLLKPVDPEDLLETAGRALEYRRLRLENRAYQANLEALVTSRTEQLRQAVSTLEKSYDITLSVLGDALDLTEALPDKHSKRVTAFTIAIARALGISQDQIRVISRGAFLHDLGKMAIPDAILGKPGPLDRDEIAVMREHSLRGYQILRKIPFLAEAAEIVYCHHENYDGTGYPRHLKGDRIPLGARIVAVANTLDAMTCDRPYRAACSFGEARAEIQRWSGRQFDPQVARTFLEIPEHVWSDLRRGIDYGIDRSSTQKWE